MSLFYAMMAAGKPLRWVVDVGTADSPVFYGYHEAADEGGSPPTGGCDPVTIRGYTIYICGEFAVVGTNENFDFSIRNTGSELGASWFTSLIVEHGGGTDTLNTTDATHSFGAGFETWRWDTSTEFTGDWTDEGGQLRTVTMVV